MADRGQAEIEITARADRLVRGLADASRRVGTWAAETARGLGTAFATAGSGIAKGLQKIKFGKVGQHALGELGGNLLTRVVDGTAAAANEVRDFEKGLVRFGMAGDIPVEKLDAIRASVNAASREVGIGRDAIQAGGQQYLALTGDVAGATSAMRQFARIAQATDAPVSDVAQATAALREAMKLDVAKDTEAAFSGLAAQGKAGAVEIKDFAAELAELAPQFATFGKATGLSGIREMGAAFQVIRKGAGSSSSAATQFKAVMSQLVDPKNVKQLKALGINVFDAKGQLRSFSTVIKEVAANKALDNTSTLANIFGREEARAGLRTLRANVAALDDMAKAGEDAGLVQRDLMRYLESDAGKIDRAMNAMKLSIASAFTPERITQFADALERVADRAEDIADAVGTAFDIIGVGYTIGQKLQTNPEKMTGGFGDEWQSYIDRTIIANEGQFAPSDFRVEEGMSSSGPRSGGTAPTSETERWTRVRQARERIEQRDAYRSTAHELVGLMNDGRTTKASTARAIALAAKGQLAGNQDYSGTVGTAEYARIRAAEDYLTGTSLGPEQLRQLFDEYLAEQAKRDEEAKQRLTAAIGGLMGSFGVELKVGDGQVARAAEQSTNARTRP